jgi:hypothetical protein
MALAPVATVIVPAVNPAIPGVGQVEPEAQARVAPL